LVKTYNKLLLEKNYDIYLKLRVAIEEKKLESSNQFDFEKINIA